MLWLLTYWILDRHCMTLDMHIMTPIMTPDRQIWHLTGIMCHLKGIVWHLICLLRHLRGILWHLAGTLRYLLKRYLKKNCSQFLHKFCWKAHYINSWCLTHTWTHEHSQHSSNITPDTLAPVDVITHIDSQMIVSFTDTCWQMLPRMSSL